MKTNYELGMEYLIEILLNIVDRFPGQTKVINLFLEAAETYYVEY